MKVKVLHVSEMEKFMPDFVSLLRKEYAEGDHVFWLVGDCNKYRVPEANGVYLAQGGPLEKLIGFVRLAVLLNSSQKVVLHGLFNPGVIFLLFLMPWTLPRCYWAMWGGDLYAGLKQKTNIKLRIKEWFKRRVIRRIGHLVTYIPGDFDIAERVYQADGRRWECIMYPSNLVEESGDLKARSGSNKPIRVLIGNSADPSNQHFEILNKLKQIDDASFEVIAPLSYGQTQYAERVKEQGRVIFGQRFSSIDNFMLREEYLQLLGSIDIAIFNHARQQAMGNTIALISKGKSVFLRRDTPHAQFLESLGIIFGDVQELSLTPLKQKDLESNMKCVCSYFSKENLKVQMEKLFEND